MSYFALLGRGLPSQPRVLECHLNHWVIPTGPFGLWGNYLFDVGLRVRFEEPTTRLRVALPFDLKEGTSVEDLSSLMTNEKVASIVFGKPVEVSENKISYVGVGTATCTEMTVIPIDVKNSSEEEENSAASGFSTFEIVFKDPAPANQDCYLRFRFSPESVERYWMDRGYSFRKLGRIVDIRVSDVRELLVLGQGEAESGNIVDIEKLFVFLACDVNYTPMHVSPDVHYSRVLEPGIWVEYLGTKNKPKGIRRLAIHQWRNPSSLEFEDGEFKTVFKPISEDRPFRAYADLKKDFGWHIAALVAGAAILAIIGSQLGSILGWIASLMTGNAI